MDLVRRIVFALEEHPHGFAPGELTFDGYTKEEVGYHAYLMKEAGLIRAANVTTLESSSPCAIPTGLTWAGHEFAEAARNDTIWNKAKEQVKEKAGGLAFGLLIEVLKHYGKQALGIP